MTLRERLENSVPKEAAFENAKSSGDPAIEQGTWLTEELWNEYAWDLKLKSGGVKWTEFMEAFGNSQYAFIQWKREEISWDAAMGELIDEIIHIR